MRALLDVNVLIALLDAGHMNHASATHWLGQEIENGWASCVFRPIVTADFGIVTAHFG